MVLKLINKLLIKLIELNRITKQLIMVFFDSILVVFVLLSAFSLRLGYWYWPKEEMYYVIEFWIIFTAGFTLNFLYSLDLWRYKGNGFCCIGLKKIVITNK